MALSTLIITANADQTRSALDVECEHISPISPVVSDLPSLVKGLKDHSPAYFVLDLRHLSDESNIQRSKEQIESTRQLLTYLSEEYHEVCRLVTISDQFLPLELVTPIERLNGAHLESPFTSDELHAALDELQKRFPQTSKNGWPQCKSISSDQLKFATLTPAMFPMLEQLARVAGHDVTLLLVGETGTGKTTLAQLIHQLSPHHDQPFMNVACGALPPDLIESELFGHIRGAFTGADRSKVGRFEAAGRGTLLLDEIDVLGAKEQAKLLKVIETKEFEPVGSTETRLSQARLIVASNVDLETLTAKNQFRSDLYYRLNVLEFRLLPLRERPLDLIPLAVQFIKDNCQQHGLSIHRVHRHFLDALRAYAWPGNLRELKNQIQRAVLFAQNGELTTEDLSPNILAAQNERHNGHAHSSPTSLADRVADTEQQILEEVLKAHGYKRSAAAAALGISRVGLYKKMRKYGMIKRKDQML